MLTDRYETTRLIVRKPIDQDAVQIFDAYARNAEVTQYLSWKPHSSLDTTSAFIRECISHWGTDQFAFSILSKDPVRLIGMLEVRIVGHKAHLGYVLAKEYWSQGLMAEALGPIMRDLLMDASIARVWAVCDIENYGSKRVMEKIGMDCEGILRRWLVLPNLSSEARDCFVYAKVK